MLQTIFGIYLKNMSPCKGGMGKTWGCFEAKHMQRPLQTLVCAMQVLAGSIFSHSTTGGMCFRPYMQTSTQTCHHVSLVWATGKTHAKTVAYTAMCNADACTQHHRSQCSIGVSLAIKWTYSFRHLEFLQLQCFLELLLLGLFLPLCLQSICSNQGLPSSDTGLICMQRSESTK